MSKATTLEQAYFHIHNGGITLSIIEKLDIRRKGPNADLAEDSYNRTWRFRVMTSHFGTRTEFEFPIVPFVLKWLLPALHRVLDRMEEPQDKPTDGVEYAFRNLKTCTVAARAGKKVEEHWPTSPEPMLMASSTTPSAPETPT